MSFHEMSEAEKAEYIRKKIVHFLPSTLIGVVLGLGGYFAYDAYDDTRTRHNVEASVAFTKFVEGDWLEEDFENQDAEEVSKNLSAGEELLAQYPEHFYADLTRFIMARLSVSQKDYDSAIAHLEEVATRNHDAYTTHLAWYRLAQMYQLKDDGTRSLEYLDKATEPSLKTVVADLRGDIYLRSYDFEKAYDSWQEAVQSSKHESLTRYLKIKLDFIESIPPPLTKNLVQEGMSAQAKIKKEKPADAADAADAEEKPEE